MGIFINLAISHSVSQSEWEAVYREALELARKLGLAEVRRLEIGGVTVRCLSWTQEYTSPSQRLNEDWTGFQICGDYETLQIAETNYVPKNLRPACTETEAADAMLEIYRMTQDYRYEPKVYQLLGNKTQGYSHHIPRLAMCCLIEDRLGAQAFTYVDITLGQCRKAVELANEWLAQPISLPDSCDGERLIRRIRALPIPVEEQLKLLGWGYLGRKDPVLGDRIRNAFGNETCSRYWESRFEGTRVETNSFSACLREYLNMGFPLERLFDVCPSLTSLTRKEQKLFVQKLLETGLCDKEKSTVPSAFDPEQESPYRVENLIEQLFHADRAERMIGVYLPQEECRAILRQHMDCPEIIAECFVAHRKMAAEATLAKTESDEEDLEEKYDIALLTDVERYRPGMTLDPTLIRVLLQILDRFEKTAEEEDCARLARKSPEERFAFLAENISLILRDRDWEKIWEAMKTQDFRRYYPAARLSTNHPAVACAVRAILLNDDLYELLLKMRKAEG